jgi:hypothetical protein
LALLQSVSHPARETVITAWIQETSLPISQGIQDRAHEGHIYEILSR